jgi:hypothetical protein
MISALNAVDQTKLDLNEINYLKAKTKCRKIGIAIA